MWKPMLAVACVAACAQETDENRKWLDNLTGEWQIEREIRGTRVSNRATGRWVLNRQFVELHMIDTASPPKYEARVTIGYVPDKKQFVAYWLDSYGPGFAAAGTGTREGNAVTFLFPYESGPFYNTFTFDPQTKRWTSLMEAATSDGGRKFFARDTYSRRAP